MSTSSFLAHVCSKIITLNQFELRAIKKRFLSSSGIVCPTIHGVKGSRHLAPGKIYTLVRTKSDPNELGNPSRQMIFSWFQLGNIHFLSLFLCWEVLRVSRKHITQAVVPLPTGTLVNTNISKCDPNL